MWIKIQEKLKSIVPTRKQRLLIGANATMLVVVIILASTNLWALCMWAKWHSVNIQTPVVLQPPITITTSNAETSGLLEPVAYAQTTKQLTDEEKTAMANKAGMGWVVTRVGALESGNGKVASGHHKFCEDYEKTNEFGYFKGGDRGFCFDSFEESVTEVTSWFENQLQSKTLNQALCLYNTGRVLADCQYARNFYAL